MNQKLLFSSTLVIIAAFAFSFAVATIDQAHAQRGVGNVVQEATNNLRQSTGPQQGLVNVGSVAVQANANVVANDVIDVIISSNR